MIGTMVNRLVKKFPHLRSRIFQCPNCWPVLETVLSLIKSQALGTYRLDPDVDQCASIYVHIMRTMGSYDTEEYVANSIKELTRLKILTVDPDGFAISHGPDLIRGLDRRQSSAPTNGRLGGRPRQGETSMEARDRRRFKSEIVGTAYDQCIQACTLAKAGNEKPNSEHEETKFPSNLVSPASASSVVVVEKKEESTTTTAQEFAPQNFDASGTVGIDGAFATEAHPELDELVTFAHERCPNWSPQQRELTLGVCRDLLADNYSAQDVRDAVHKSAASNGPNFLRKSVRRSSLNRLTIHTPARAKPADDSFNDYPEWKSLNSHDRAIMPKLIKIINEGPHAERHVTAAALMRFRGIYRSTWDHAVRRWPWLDSAANWIESHGDLWPMPSAGYTAISNVRFFGFVAESYAVSGPPN